MFWAFTLKIAFSNFFSTEEEVFEHLWPRILIIFLFALNTELVFLEATKEVILCN